MGLSAERMASLEDHYEVWGLEDVRRELERPDRDLFVDPDVTAFARAWVAAKEASIQSRERRMRMALVTLGLVLLGVSIAVIRAF